MPYKSGTRLPVERASRLGHLDVLKSEHVSKLIESFESVSPPIVATATGWQDVKFEGRPLSIVFGIDGSIAPIEDLQPPLYKR